MNPEYLKLETTITKELGEQREIINKILVSVEKTRKYYLWTMVATLIIFVLPLIAIAFVVPTFISSYNSYLSGAGLGL